MRTIRMRAQGMVSGGSFSRIEDQADRRATKLAAIVVTMLLCTLFSSSTVLAAACLALPTPKTRIDPHSFMNDSTRCVRCHQVSGRDGEVVDHEFVREIDEICLACHKNSKLGLSHPRGVSMQHTDPRTQIPENLPLSPDSEITCGTCHNPHARGFLLEAWYPSQKPEFEEVQSSVRVAYYKSHYLRLEDCGGGFTTLCLSCHVAY